MHYGYILRGTVTGLYKIGIAGNALKRFSQYKTHVPERVVLEAVKQFISEEEARDWERWILFLYRESSEHGEWLRLTFDEAATVWGLGLFAPELHPRGMPAPNGTRFLMTQQKDESAFTVRVFRCAATDVSDWHFCLEYQLLSNFTYHPREVSRHYITPRKAKTQAWLEENRPNG